MKLSVFEIRELLRGLTAVHGPGYSQDEAVARLQAKLSVALEVQRTIELVRGEKIIEPNGNGS